MQEFFDWRVMAPGVAFWTAFALWREYPRNWWKSLAFGAIMAIVLRAIYLYG